MNAPVLYYIWIPPPVFVLLFITSFFAVHVSDHSYIHLYAIFDPTVQQNGDAYLWALVQTYREIHTLSNRARSQYCKIKTSVFFLFCFVFSIYDSCHVQSVYGEKQGPITYTGSLRNDCYSFALNDFKTSRFEIVVSRLHV